jgi:hypothetical protein
VSERAVERVLGFEALDSRGRPTVACVVTLAGGAQACATVPSGAFDFGAARDAHERRWPSDLQDSFVALLMALPLPYRAYVRRELYPRVTALAERQPVTAGDLARLWQELAATSGLPATLADSSSPASDQPLVGKESRA